MVLPVVWLGALGAGPLEKDLIDVLGPTFAPLFGAAAGTAAIWFMVLNMFHGTLQPLAGASRTIYQLAEDGLLPRILGRRSDRDVPWVATLLTAGLAIVFLQSGNPVWVIAAANGAERLARGTIADLRDTTTRVRCPPRRSSRCSAPRCLPQPSRGSSPRGAPARGLPTSAR